MISSLNVFFCFFFYTFLLVIFFDSGKRRGQFFLQIKIFFFPVQVYDVPTTTLKRLSLERAQSLPGENTIGEPSFFYRNVVVSQTIRGVAGDFLEVPEFLPPGGF